jgi:flavodoxin
MKKFLSISTFVFSYALTVCAQTGNTNTTTGKVLVTYFSRAGENYSVGHITVGNTAVVAQKIQALTSGDLFEIVPVTPYPDGYEATKTIATRERNNNERPAIKNHIPNIGEYDVIFVGYPIWYADTPMIMRTFFEEYNMAGKTVIPFCTHEGSGLGQSVNEIKNLCSRATVLDGLAVRGSNVTNSQDAVSVWLRKIGMVK